MSAVRARARVLLASACELPRHPQFIRDSVEKRAELERFGHGLPGHAQYEWLLGVLAAQLGWREVHLQTSSGAAFVRLLQYGRLSGLRLAYTENTRSDHDRWAGWLSGTEHNRTTETAVAVVNQYIASRAGVLIGLSSSAWTSFVAVQMQHEARAPAEHVASLCCNCKSRDRYHNLSKPSNVEVVVASRARSVGPNSNLVLALRNGRKLRNLAPGVPPYGVIWTRALNARGPSGGDGLQACGYVLGTAANDRARR